MIRLNVRTIKITFIALLVAVAFAIIDQYILNASSYLVRYMFAVWFMERGRMR